MRRRTIAKHELSPAPLDRMPLAGVERSLKLIEAGRRGGPAAIAIPGKPAPAVQPDAQPVHGSQRNQADSHTRNSHEEHHAHGRPTHQAVQPFSLAARFRRIRIAAYLPVTSDDVRR